MKDWQDLVCEFHKVKGFNINTHKIGRNKPARWVSILVKICGYMIYGIGKIILLIDKLSERLHCRHFLIFRSHIIIEEVGETIIAVANGDEIKAADGIGDSIIVLLGLAVICNLPMDTILKEINRSNMTKGFYDKIGGRKKGIYKGPHYCHPDIRWAIHEGRKKKVGGTQC